MTDAFFLDPETKVKALYYSLFTLGLFWQQTHGNCVEGVEVGLEAGVDMTTTEEGVIMVSLGSSSTSLDWSGSKVGAVRVSKASSLAHFPTAEKTGEKYSSILKSV